MVVVTQLAGLACCTLAFVPISLWMCNNVGLVIYLALRSPAKTHS